MLKELFNKYNTDKAEKHHYDVVYHSEFKSILEQPLNILEVGVLEGHSIQAWLEYFPNANLYGVDTFERVGIDEIEVADNPRVKLLKADSTNISINIKINKEWPDTKFDIIIDDGLHTPRANALTFKNLIPFLKEDGAYYVEDVWPLDKMTSNQLNHYWLKRHAKDYTSMEMNYFLQSIDSYKVERFDNRQLSGEGDSYIIKLTR